MDLELDFVELTTSPRAVAALSERCKVSFEGFAVVVLTNSPALVEGLRSYFGPLVQNEEQSPAQTESCLELWACEAPEPQLALDYQDWPRAEGKSGRKEEFAHLGAGRVVRKVRTGMHFFIGPKHRIAFGPCTAQINQVINFLNAQVIAHFMAQRHQLCHAAAVYVQERGIMIAAASGAGKSTLAMHLMTAGAQFTSNDRLLIQRSEGSNTMLGVPKWPRVNPGTLLHNPALKGILPASRETELRTLPKHELWELEEKYDVPVADVFGSGQIKFGGQLDLLVLLDWTHASQEPTAFTEIRLDERPEKLELLVKNAGPLVYDEATWQSADQGERVFDWQAYLDALAGVPVLLCEGGPDFAAAALEIKRRTGREQ